MVVVPVVNPYYDVGNESYNTTTEFADSINDWYNQTYGTTTPVITGTSSTLVFHNDEPIIVGCQPIVISSENLNDITGGNFQVTITGAGSIKRAQDYTGPLFVIGTGSNKVTITAGTLILDGDKQNTSAISPALVIDSGATLELQNAGSLLVQNNYNGAPGGNGGGIYNAGTISVAGTSILMQVTNNTAVNGGGIYNAGTLDKLSNTYVTNNHASSLGGAVYNTGTIKNSVITRTGNTVGPSFISDNTIYQG